MTKPKKPEPKPTPNERPTFKDIVVAADPGEPAKNLAEMRLDAKTAALWSDKTARCAVCGWSVASGAACVVDGTVAP